MITAFQTALKTGDLDAIRRVPKSDLHNHFFLGGNRVHVSEWAGKDIAPLDHKLGCMAELHEWVQTRFGTLFVGAQGRLKAFEATLVQAKLDGIMRLETGETPWAITPTQRLRDCPDGRVERRAGARRAGHRVDSAARLGARGAGRRPSSPVGAVSRARLLAHARHLRRRACPADRDLQAAVPQGQGRRPATESARGRVGRRSVRSRSWSSRRCSTGLRQPSRHP